MISARGNMLTCVRRASGRTLLRQQRALGSVVASNRNGESDLLKYGCVGAALVLSTMELQRRSVKCEKSVDRLISYEELQKHTSLDSLWVCYKGGVYDVTEFTTGHPGGTDRLEMAAGHDMEPFFMVYTEHFRGHVLPFMNKYFRIGHLSAADVEKVKHTFANPYANDPIRHPELLHCTSHPFNGEARLALLCENYYTPNELHYTRNHLPVPDIADEDWELEVSGVGVKNPKTYTLQEIKTKFKKHEVVNCFQCAGNRRDDFHGSDFGEQKIFISPHWIVGAISNAKWGGALMRDILKDCGVDVDSMSLGLIKPHDLGIKHLQCVAYDATETGITYGSSVPIDRVLDPLGSAMVAYEMNGVPVPPDHGKPARALFPGHAGCRSSKWIHELILSDKESEKPWQNKSYLGFSPNYRFEADPDEVPGKALWKWTYDPILKAYLNHQQNVTYGHLGRAICQIQPVTSMICKPTQNEIMGGCPDEIEIKGVGHSFGGSGLNRVDVSIDGGVNWEAADLYKPDDVLKSERFGKMYGWCLFSAKVRLTTEQKKILKAGNELNLELVSKAVDTHFNVQPERPEPYYNPRGITIGHMYRVPLLIDPNKKRAAERAKTLKAAHDKYYKPDPLVTPANRTGQEFPNKPTGGIFLVPWVHDNKQVDGSR